MVEKCSESLDRTIGKVLSICPTKRFPHRLERLKYTKSGHTIGHKIGHKIGHCFPGSRSKIIDLGVTQPDFQIV